MNSKTTIIICVICFAILILFSISGVFAYYSSSTTQVPTTTTTIPTTTIVPTTPVKSCSALVNIRLPGGGYLQGTTADHISPFPANSQTATDCQTLCQNNSNCKQYVFNGPGLCYMMNQSYPNYSADTATAVGVQSGMC